MAEDECDTWNMARFFEDAGMKPQSSLKMSLSSSASGGVLKMEALFWASPCLTVLHLGFAIGRARRFVQQTNPGPNTEMNHLNSPPTFASPGTLTDVLPLVCMLVSPSLPH